MNKNGSASKVKISSFDDLFGVEQVPAGVEQVQEIPLSELHEFKGHPFKVLDDEKMQETVESIKNYGVLMPGIARPRAEGGYELIAGHRRKHGCGLAGLSVMPVFVRDYSDDEATIIMVDSNIQREDILPSEKARAYAMKYEAMKHQGKKGSGSSLDEVGEAAGESGKTVQRYIWLARLSDTVSETGTDSTEEEGSESEKGKEFYTIQTASEGKLLEMRVWDCGKSECHSVMEWIGVQNLPHPKGEQTSAWCLITREFIEFLKGVKQMDMKMCATSDVAKEWDKIDWNKANAYVKKLQMRIVKAHQEGKHGRVKSLQWLLTHSFYARAYRISRMRSRKNFCLKS